ncbi:serine/threonine-protein kinase [Parasphingorhabdus sp.]|uniref:serine/threonine-protein kinase n=1 Tax=Parasphingorhabdus sp. TaxID=2709688 RepID=UPI0032675FB0
MADPKPSVDLAAMELFERAMEQPFENRSAFIADQSDIDGEIIARALQLLKADSNSLGSLQTGGAASLQHNDDSDPERIGAYRILRMLGKGGMGAVYMGERASDDFDHVVAIKLIKPGLLTDILIERFRRERQILAQLNHQHIAHLHDGGEMEDGSPYIVMEYVDGVPLSEWMVEQKPNLDRRLHLFLQICDAVEFAHQNLVIHRDLTPSNVLVAEGDQVKLIDFGIARPQVEGGDEGTASTFSGLSLTPGFAAPERSTGPEANTLSDIYSLGRILHLLIKDHSDSELAAIADKAASDDPRDRYATATGLKSDLQDYRECFPVQAFANGRSYRLGKFVKRQKLMVGSIFAIFLLTVSALVVVTQAYRVTETARNEAELSLTETQDMANVLMFDVFDGISSLPGATEERHLVATTAQTYLRSLSENPNATRKMRLAAGRGYYRLATATGTIAIGNIGKWNDGLALFEEAAKIVEPIYKESPTDDVRLVLAKIHVSLARDKLLTYEDTHGAPEHAKRASMLLLEITKPSVESVAAYGESQRYLGDSLMCCNYDPDGGRRALQEGIVRISKAPERIRRAPSVQQALIDLRQLMAGYLYFVAKTDRQPAAINQFQSVLLAQRRLIAEHGASPSARRQYATIARNLSQILVDEGRPEEADAIITPIYRSMRQDLVDDPSDKGLQRDLSVISLTYASVAVAQGRNADAVEATQQGLRDALLSEGLDGKDDFPPMRYAHRVDEAAKIYWSLKNRQKACELMRASQKVFLSYKARNELPETSQRLRLVPIEQRLKNCPDI